MVIFMQEHMTSITIQAHTDPAFFVSGCSSRVWVQKPRMVLQPVRSWQGSLPALE
jgi:hypothetical protein